MDVKIQEIKTEIPVKTKGVEFRVRENDGTFLGDFYITATGIEWCKGKIAQNKGKSMTWKEFIEFMENR